MALTKGGEKTNLQCYYDVFDDGGYSIFDNFYLAQTFTPLNTHHLFCVSVKLYYNFPPPWLEMAIQGTAGVGYPDNVDISVRRVPGLDLHQWTPKWYSFYFDDFPLLTAGVKYAFILRAPDATPFNAAIVRAHRTAAWYFDGQIWASDDYGGWWNSKPWEDVRFREWGYEPPPAPPPLPSISNWAPLTYQHTDLITGFTIVITTDIPCHLYMRWTDKKPLKHPTAEYRRGILVPIGTRYCFVAWEENEQIEPGDTLIHTFEKRNWPICQTRYFYFTGTVQDQEQPSASPIFQLHRTEEYQPSVYGPVAATFSNRTLEYTWGTWHITHDSPTGTILPWHNPPQSYLYVWTRLTVSYFLRRSFLFFDTSPIPTGSIITGATLSVFCLVTEHTSSIARPYIYITQGVQQDPVITTDYGAQLPFTTVGGAKDITTFVIGQYNDIEFNADGLNFINIGGITKLCLRGQMDVEDYAPPLGSNAIQYHSSQKGVGKQPLLTVYYIPP